MINDGSTDKTGEVLARLKGEFEYLRIVTRKPPRAGRGKGYVLNDGVRICQGEVIAVFDADARIDLIFWVRSFPTWMRRMWRGCRPGCACTMLTGTC